MAITQEVIFKVGTTDAVKTVKDLRDNVNAYKNELIALSIGSDAYNETVAKLAQSQAALKNVNADVTASVKAQAQEMQQATQLGKAHEKSLVSLRARLKELTLAYDRVNPEGKIARGLKTEIDEITVQLNKLEQGTGRFQRSVGNYGIATQGLNLSVAQIARELPALSINLNTFFLAISNNIPMLVDEINKLKIANAAANAAGQESVPIMSSVMKAVFSWNTVISVGVTLLTVFGGKIVEYIMNLGDAKKAQDELTESLDDLGTALEARYEQLIGAGQNEEKALEAAIKSFEGGERARLQILRGSGQITQEEYEKSIEQYNRYVSRLDEIRKRNAEDYKKMNDEINRARTGELLENTPDIGKTPDIKVDTSSADREIENFQKINDLMNERVQVAEEINVAEMGRGERLTYLIQEIALNEELLNSDRYTTEEKIKFLQDIISAEKEVANERKKLKEEEEKEKWDWKDWTQGLNRAAGEVQSIFGQLGSIYDMDAKNQIDALTIKQKGLDKDSAAYKKIEAEKEKVSEEAFEKKKNIDSVNATIDAFKSASGAFSAMSSIPFVGPALGAAAAATALAFGLKQVQMIRQQQYVGSSDSGSASVSTPSMPELRQPIQQTSTYIQGADEDVINKFPQAVLVVEDLNQVQNRVKVAEGESSF